MGGYYCPGALTRILRLRLNLPREKFTNQPVMLTDWFFFLFFLQVLDEGQIIPFYPYLKPSPCVNNNRETDEINLSGFSNLSNCFGFIL